MRYRYSVLLAAALSVGAAQVASAADIPVKAPVYKAPAAVVAQTWTGFYVGGHAGYGWSHNSWTFPFDEFYNTAAGQSFSTNPEGFVGGVHGGYNRQVGNWVFGIEASYDPTRIKENLVGPVDPTFPADSFETKVGELITVTGRVGHANNSWLVYVKGGWANARLSLDALSGPPVPGVTASVNKRVNGGTAGVGTEYMVARNIILGLEYDWVGLSSASFTSTTSTGARSI